MEQVGLLGVIFSFIILIVFFVMAVALGNISSSLRDIKKVLYAWQGETGYGVVYTCNTCKKEYKGKQPKCPHCGAEKVYV
jgi:hypothetical protein